MGALTPNELGTINEALLVRRGNRGLGAGRLIYGVTVVLAVWGWKDLIGGTGVMKCGGARSPDEAAPAPAPAPAH